MEVVPLSVGEVSRTWDEQSIDLTSAAQKVSGASARGFTAAVSGAACRFTSSWDRHTRALATAAETRADGLRTTIAVYLATDGRASQDYFGLLVYTEEIR